MTIKHQCMLSLLVKLGKDAPEVKTPGITDRDDPKLHMSSEEDIVPMMHATEALLKNNHKPSLLHANELYGSFRALFDEIHAPRFEQNKQNFPTFVLFLDTEIQQTKTISHSTMFLFVGTMLRCDYNATAKRISVR